MSKLPYWPVYPDSFLTDTDMFDLTERGAWVVLCMHMWRHGGWIPDDNEKISRLLRITPGKWSKLRPTFEPFFKKERELLSNEKLLDQYAHAVGILKQRREAGLYGASVKKLKNQEAAEANATPNGSTNAPAEGQAKLDRPIGQVAEQVVQKLNHIKS